MIYTTYFGMLKRLPKNIIPVSISAYPPDWYKGCQYSKLAPDKASLRIFKMVRDEDRYTRDYKNKILYHLTAEEVIGDLNSTISREVLGYQAAIGEPIEDPQIALVCFEGPKKFCHRHIIAEWLTANGFPCEEYDPKKVIG